MTIERATGVGPRRIEVAYERFGDPGAPALLLIMGAGTQMHGWPDDFCAQLAARGFHVVRFDNRDVGESTHFHDAPEPDLPAVIAGDASTASYTLSDMAADTVGLLDVLGVRAAHLVGASLGGFVAQTLAIERAARAWERDHDPLGIARQAVAAVASGDRTEKLRRLATPTLVVHGTTDPFCDVSGGRATAAAIPGADLLLIEGMSHDLPRPVWPRILDAIVTVTRSP
jgi:pimeloyl-ACP methyl ester carboxylesterase